MNVNNKQQYIMTTVSNNFKEWLLNNIDFEGYEGIKKYRKIGREINPQAKESKIQIGLGIFASEYGHEIKRVGEQAAFKEYLQGLPSWIDIPFYYYDIRNLMYSLGYEVDKLDNSDLSTIYYQLITNVFFQD